VVVDDRVPRGRSGKLLEAARLNVIAAEGGPGLFLAPSPSARAGNLILLDISMPGHGRWAVALALRQMRLNGPAIISAVQRSPMEEEARGPKPGPASSTMTIKPYRSAADVDEVFHTARIEWEPRADGMRTKEPVQAPAAPRNSQKHAPGKTSTRWIKLGHKSAT